MFKPHKNKVASPVWHPKYIIVSENVKSKKKKFNPLQSAITVLSVNEYTPFEK